MTTRDPETPGMPERDYKTIAAEFSLGLLEGEELMAARGRLLSDPDFAWRKDWWDDWFIPLSDDIAGAEPGEHVWQAISARLGKAGAGEAAEAADAANIAALEEARAARESAKRWRLTAALTSLAAAVAIAVLVVGPGTTPVSEPVQGERIAAAPLMASMPVGESLRLGITYLPGQREMLVSASGLTSDGVHDHELWLVPGDGGPLQSLGVVAPGKERRFQLPDDVTRNIADGAQLVLTREPLGGKPEGVEAGPVVADARLGAV
ncbi:MAG: anti-sigma factor [Erythrobacter sp.]|jgi:anti-sigma-K factor RskA|nr:anti-sigma factor [Erythrobacter sp.]